MQDAHNKANRKSKDKTSTMKQRHTEIAGAGLAGLTMACVLAQRGWSVRVHERSNELREMGAGIYLKVNSLAVLSSLGILDDLRATGAPLNRAQLLDASDEVLAERALPVDEMLVLLRSELHGALAAKAQALGVDIQTRSEVVSAGPDGKLLTSTGKELNADLVVGADGVGSKVRDSVGLQKSVRLLPEGAIRVLVDRRAGEKEGLSTEQWSREVRLGITPCSADKLYLYMIGPASKPEAAQIPVHKDFWCERFPRDAHIISRIEQEAARHDQLKLVKVKAWHTGRVAILGDAAHGQPPNLGQGAGMGIANAHALAVMLDEYPEVEPALASWEMERRAVSDAVRNCSYYYGVLFRAFQPFGPEAEVERSDVVRDIHASESALGRLGWLNRGGHDIGMFASLRKAFERR